VWQGKNADPEKGITVGERGLLGREKREWKSGEINSARRHRSMRVTRHPTIYGHQIRHEFPCHGQGCAIGIAFLLLPVIE
jgi:hypothetical protein